MNLQILQSNNINNFMYIFIIFLIMVFLLYMIRIIQRRNNNCLYIKQMSKFNNFDTYLDYQDLINRDFFTSDINIRNNDISYNYKLKDYYIKTAYNACCSGKYKNDYVDICALKNCAKYGVRALDFQVFSLDGNPIVGASTVNSNFYKETYNHLSLENVMTTVNNEFLGNSTETSNYKKLKHDPLFLFLRIHYGSIDKDNSDYRESIQNFYKRIYNVLKHSFGNNFDKFYSNQYPQIKFNNNEDIVFSDRSEQISNMDMKDLRNHIFLFVSTQDVKSSTLKNSELGKLVDLNMNGHEMNLYRENEIDNNSDNTIISNENKRGLSICLPPKVSNNKNYDFVPPMTLGIQFVAMNYQNEDTNLNNYNRFFKYPNLNASSAYVKKPNKLISFPAATNKLFNI